MGIAVSAAALIALPSCSRASASSDEVAVCAAIQEMVNRLASGDGPGGLQSLTAIEAATGATDNETLRSAGEAFFASIGAPVDYGSLTVQESVDLGNEVLSQASTHFNGMADECARLGEPITATTAARNAE